MKKTLIIISILIGIFALGSLDSQKVIAYSDCGNYACGQCPAGNSCGFNGQQCCCSNGCNNCFPGTCGPAPTDAPTCNANNWGGCSVSCGPGTQTNECGTTRGCNNGACCDPNNWGGWGACSVACGGGTQSRTNACGTSQTQACNAQACVVPTATPIPTATLVPCPKKAQGDANCDGQVNLLDYFYYVAKKAGATLPATVNADFNANGTVDDADRTIVVRTLKP